MQLIIQEPLDLLIVLELLLVFLLFAFGFLLDKLVEFLYFGQFACQDLVLGFYQAVEEGAGLDLLDAGGEVRVAHGEGVGCLL